MRQIEVFQFGGPEVLHRSTGPDLTPGPGQVLVGVTVVGVLGLDIAIRRGAGGPFATTPPYVPGQGAAGVVRAVGEGVDPAWVGRRVVTDVHGGGAYAEQLLAPADDLVPVPDEIDDRVAAALMHDGRTAITLLTTTPITAEDTVLVLPAAGGLGSILVQLAAGRGAHVIGAARGSDKAAVVRSLGAHQTVDYTQLDWTQHLHRVDVVFDGVGGEIGRQAAALLTGGGRFSSYGLAGGEVTTLDTTHVREHDITTADMSQLMVSPAAHRARIETIFAAAAAGDVTPVIGRVDPLYDAADAHIAFESRQIIGKALLIVD